MSKSVRVSYFLYAVASKEDSQSPDTVSGPIAEGLIRILNMKVVGLISISRQPSLWPESFGFREVLVRVRVVVIGHNHVDAAWNPFTVH